ncbi:MAG: VWA domain-containing protein, partial [Acutalibacteraceae bacterium]
MKMKKIVSLFLVALMAFSVIPTGVFTLSVSAVQSDAYATIITGSDYQDSSVRQANVTALLSQIKAGGYTNTPDGVFFGGDYSNSSMNTDATEGTTELMGLITDAYPDFNPDNAVFIQGNHDAQTGYVVAPYEHEFPDYITYALNEDVFASYQSQGTVEALAKKLQTYLSELIAAGDTRPVFVLSHVPLHASDRKDNTYAKLIVDVLNEAAESLDIVFMFGHNHSSDYDDYIGGAVNYIAKGEDLRVFNLGSDTEYTESPINFTYMNYGYVGYSGNADSNTSTSTLTMGVFELCPTTIEISRYSKTGLYTTETINLINPKVTTPYVSISGNTTVTQGDGDTVTAKIQNFTNPTYTWTSSNTDAVKISGTGKSAQLIYTAPGTSTITLTVTDEDGTTVSDSYEVTVTGKTYEYVYHEGETYYTYDLVDGPTDGGEYVIASSNTAGDTTAMSNTISGKVVTAVSVTVESGTDEIPAAHITNPDSTAIWKATTNTNGGYTLSNTSLSNNANLRAKDNKTAELKNNTDKTVAWTYTSNQLYNSDKGAYISYNGTAYAVSTSGTNVYFYEKTEHQTEAWTETVEHELTYSPASTLTMGGIDTDGKTHKYYEITLGDTLTLVGSFSGFGENAGNVTVTWSSSNDSVVSVDNGVVTFNGDGAATISYTVSDGETTLTKSVDFVLSRAQKPTFTFKLTDTLEDGKTYIIASSNTAGSTNVMTDSVLYLDGNWMPNRLNYISQTIEEIDGEMTMIVEDETAFWTASDDGTGQIMLVSEDSGKILRAASTGITLLDSASDDGIYWTVSGNSISNDRGYGPQVSGEGGFRAEFSGTNYLYELVQTDPYTMLKADGISVDGKTQTLYSVTDTSTATLVGSYFNFGAGITQQWISSDETIATVSNGVVSFTGKEGTVDITYRVTDESGAEVVKTTTFVTSQSKEPSRVFKPVTSFTPGKNYIIVNSSSVGASYYMNNTPASSATRLGRTYAVIQPDESDNSVFIEIPVADGGAGIWTAATSGTDGYVTLQNEESAQYLSLTYVSGGYATVATADAVSSSDSDPFAFGVNSSGKVIGLDANSSGTNVVIRYSGDGNFRGGNADDSESSGVYLFEETVLEQAVHIRSMYQNIDGTVAERKDVCKWQTETLLPRPVNFDTEDITYTWESSNPDVATVDENGVVTYTGAGGETVITLTATSNKASLDGTYPTATATTTLKVIENSINGIPEGTYRYVITDHFEPGQIYAFSHSNAVGNHHIMNCWPYDYSSTEKRLYDNVEDFYDSAYGVYFDCSDKSIGWECIATDTDGQYYFKSIQTGQYLVLNNSGGVRSVTVSDTLTEYSDSAYRISYNTTKMNPYSAQSVSSENYMSPNSDGSSYRLSTDPSPVYIYKQSDGSEFTEVKAQIRIDAYGGNKDITNVLQNRYDVYPGMTERLLSYVVGLENITVTWESDNTNVASVDNEGLVTYTGLEGFASITMTVTGTNAAGETVTMSVRTTLSPNPESYTSPTEDYPEYPHEGSVRIGKTASGTAGGYNFQTSGVTEVELGVTGVPMTQPVDVVIVFDHSSSMNSENRLTNAIEDTKEFALQLVNKNEKNRIAIVTFDKYTEVFQSFTSTSPSYTTSGDENRIVTGDGTPEGAFVTIDDAEKMVSQIDSLQYNDIAGTNYDDGLSKCYQILKASQNDPNANKKKYVIFMSDGEPYVFNRVQLTYDDVTTAWLTGDETQATLATYLKDPSKYPVADYFNTDGNNWFAEAIKAPLGSDVDLPLVSYYDGYRTGLGATVFSIGYSSDARGSLTEGVLQRIASSEENFYRAESNLQEAYDRILESILYAANEAVVTDKMGENYNLQFAQSFTLGNSMATINLDPAPYIEVGSWTLNSDGSRNEYTSIEKITFETNSSGALTAAYSDQIDSGTTNIYDVSSNKIIGKYVTYDVLNEEFKWNIGDIDRDEVTLKYYAYLEGSAEGERAAGTYDTNEYAVLDYHNYLDNVCQQTFPVPSLGWKEAAVNYEFYLVNENGQPVNSEGVVVPFEERVLVGNKQTETVLLNSSGELSAIELIASEKIPEGYTLFNPDAQYSVRISSGDNASEAEIIDEGKSVVTTYYYDGTTKYNQSGIVPNASEYTNTNVAFAVLYQTGIIPDSVVIDYGLPVKISVLANDLIKTGTINAIGTQIADNTVLNNTGYTESKLLDASDKLTLENGEASVSDKQIIYQPTNMTMSDEEVFYYE